MLYATIEFLLMQIQKITTLDIKVIYNTKIPTNVDDLVAMNPPFVIYNNRIPTNVD